VRLIAKNTLVAFWTKNPDARASLQRWCAVVKMATWNSMDEVQRAFPNATILNSERARFKVAGNSYRLIVAFHFRAQIAFVKFVGSHADYDKVNALTVSQF
jgi:mRNA interferase HigB